MKRVAIITWNSYLNFGTYLQAYALQQYIKSLGCDCKTLNDSTLIPNFTNWKFELKKVAWKLKPNYRACCQSKEIASAKYRKFKDSYLDIDYNIDAKYLNTHYSTFVCGSDQIWNPYGMQHPYSGFYYATFTNQTKIAYAPSIGVQKVPIELQDEFKKRICAFKYLSAREPQGQKTMHELTDTNVEIVVDPTLLLSKEHYAKLVREITPPDCKNILILYLLTPNRTYINAVKEYAKKHKLRIRMFFLHKEYYGEADELLSAGPLEFLATILNAQCVFTDSFHGTIFSSIFEKTFVTFKRFQDDSKSQNSRVTHLLEMMGLCDRWIDEDNIDKIEQLAPIDFERVRKNLAPYIAASKQYITKALLS